MIRLFLAGLALMLPCMIASAQTATLQPVLQEHGALDRQKLTQDDCPSD